MRLGGHGLTSSTLQRLLARAVMSQTSRCLGSVSRMNELSAAIGLVQLEKLYDWNEKRRALTLTYAACLREPAPASSLPSPQIECHATPHSCRSSYTTSYADREQVIEQLRADGIQTIHYPPVHALSLYARPVPRRASAANRGVRFARADFAAASQDGRGRRRARRTVAGQEVWLVEPRHAVMTIRNRTSSCSKAPGICIGTRHSSRSSTFCL